MAKKGKEFRHVTSGAYAQKGPVMRTSLFEGHWGVDPLRAGALRVVKGYQVYTNEAAYNKVKGFREKFAAAFSGKKSTESLAAKASAACAGVAPGKRAACFVGHLSSIGHTYFQ